ncbi:hypothetical protein B0H14DRAFT_2591981 [Mycena olivaceomarginata]|nr:hypothetical protein B0H14DRAFT_2591981 [Mycena olivaceomarginata]
MPARQALLDEETRQQLRAASRRRYEEKNKERRREAAKIRMQGVMLLPHTSLMTHLLLASELALQHQIISPGASIERRRQLTRRTTAIGELDAAQREQRRIADAETRRARKQEARALKRKHAAARIPAPHAKLTTPRKPAKTAPSKSKPAPAPSASHRRPTPPEQEEDTEDGEDAVLRGLCTALQSATVQGLRARRLPGMRLHVRGVNAVVRPPRWPFLPRLQEMRCDRLPWMCINLPPPFSMPFGALPYDHGVLLCIPIYSPDAGHEDRYTHTGGLFAVVHENFKGVVTSDIRASLTRTLTKYPGARTFNASTWSELDRRWTFDCTEYHEHQGETREVRARHALRVRQQRRNEEHHFKLVALAEAIRVEEEEERRVKEEMDFLAATRPPPVPLSPQRARQLFDRVLGAGAGTPPFALRKGPPPQTPPSAETLLEEAHRRTSRLQGLPAYSDVQVSGEGEAPGLYAVHAGSYNRVFNDRARAVEVLRGTPNAELAFIGDEQRLWQFLDGAP